MAASSSVLTVASPLLLNVGSPTGGPVLEDTFLAAGNRSPVKVILNYDAVTMTPAEGGVSRRLPFGDIVGAEVDPKRLVLIIHSYPLSTGACCGCCFTKCKPHRYHVATDLFHSSRDIAVLRRWQLRITQICRRAPLDDNIPTRHILVLVNPAGGSGKAALVLDSVRPLFRHANIKLTEKRTEYAQHAFEIAYHLDVYQYDAIVTVSGDGLLSEVVNGLFNRRDWRAAINRLQLGTIPGGSGNGLAMSILTASGEPFSALSAAFLAAQSYTRALDVFTIVQDNKRPTFGFLSFSWAVISDIDFESEQWRCCGGFRFTWTALNRLCCLRTYDAVMSYIPADEKLNKNDGKDTRKATSLPKCGPNCRHCTTWGSIKCEGAALERYLASEAVAKTRASLDPRVSKSRSPPSSSFAPTSGAPGALSASDTMRATTPGVGVGLTPAAATEVKSVRIGDGIHLHVDDSGLAVAGAAGIIGVTDEKKAAAPSTSSTSLVHEVKTEDVLHPAEKRDTPWVEFTDAFAMVWALNVTHAANDMHSAPFAHLSDGCLDFTFVRGGGANCCNVLGTFLAVDSGDHVNKDIVEYIKVRALRLQPRSTRPCELNVDGERVGTNAMELRVFRGILNFICH